jgi:predicted nucleotide-binding protein
VRYGRARTATTDGERMSAKEALDFLTSRGMNSLDAVSAICTRAHATLVAARAKTFILDSKRHSDVDVPTGFWWAEGREALTHDWATGYFETWVDDGNTRLQAFDVTFRRQDIEQLTPATAASLAAQRRPAQKTGGLTIFIGHGHSQEWRKLAMFLQNDHGLSFMEFNSSSPAGISTTDHLQAMLDQVNFAFLILTGEDEQATGEFNPRLNVVHEIGLFQGKLGFRKAILFLEERCQEFSNVRGLTHIPFPKGEIEA